MRTLLVCGLVLFLSACSSVPPICEPGNARQAGIAQAMRGEEFNESAGGVCENEHKAAFRTNFMAGYQEGKGRFCAPPSAEQTGLSHGVSGAPNQYQEANYRICESRAELKVAYTRGYKQGLGQFCAGSDIRNAGKIVGERGAAPEFGEEKYQICGADKVKSFRAQYLAGHKEGVAHFCEGIGIENQASAEGSSGAEKSDITGKFHLCSAKQVAKIAKRYADAYEAGVGQFCAPPNIENEAKAQAQTSSTPTLPAKYAKCFAKNVDLKTLYNNTFAAERKRYVEATCTYQKGLERGRADAERVNDKVTTMPEFCDSQLFSVFLNGYIEGFKQTKDRVCDSSPWYQEGLRQGNTGMATPNVPPAVGNCPPDYQNAMRQRFSEGYQLGYSQFQSNQRIAAAQAAAQAPVAYGNISQKMCNSNLDCGLGQMCKDRGDRVKLCMSNGQRGQFCVSSVDCASGLFCREQANRLRVCN